MSVTGSRGPVLFRLGNTGSYAPVLPDASSQSEEAIPPQSVGRSVAAVPPPSNPPDDKQANTR